MTTLDRLRDLAEIAGDELMSDSHVEFFNEFFVAWPKIQAVVEAAAQAVETIDKVMVLTDAYINVNISGKDFRFDPTKELKDKLAALDENSVQ